MSPLIVRADNCFVNIISHARSSNRKTLGMTASPIPTNPVRNVLKQVNRNSVRARRVRGPLARRCLLAGCHSPAWGCPIKITCAGRIGRGAGFDSESAGGWGIGGPGSSLFISAVVADLAVLRNVRVCGIRLTAVLEQAAENTFSHSRRETTWDGSARKTGTSSR